MNWASDAPFFDETIKFLRSGNDLKIAKYMFDNFRQAKGDLVTYTEILMKYYQNLVLYKPTTKKKGNKEYPPLDATIVSNLDKKVHKNNVEAFANMVDCD